MSPQTVFIAAKKLSIRATTTNLANFRSSQPALIPKVHAVDTLRGDLVSACAFSVLDASIETTLPSNSSSYAFNAFWAGSPLRCDGATTRCLVYGVLGHSLGNC